MATVAIAQSPARCSPQCALSVVKTQKYPLSLAKVGRCTAVIATVRSKRADNVILTFTAHGLELSGLCMLSLD